MKFLDSINVERIFHEKNAGNTELNAMIDYARTGDIIFIYSIEMMGKNVKQTIRFITQTQEKNIELFIKKEKLDTYNQFGKHTLNVISALGAVFGASHSMERDEVSNEKGRLPRELAELSDYVKLVENKEMTVTEVCKRLKIGRTTYYRRCKTLENEIENN